ncbi:MAG: hypothetical protein MUE92_12520 [Chloroflexi bacterium]|jgi:hypothetical protein|nr:hypothetical protein [Chloroflexota bacterium]
MDDRPPTPAPGEGAPPASSDAASGSSAALPDRPVSADVPSRGAGSADAARADEARRRFHEQGVIPIEPDDRIGVMLAPGELVLAVRRSASLDRRHHRRADDPGLPGDLYVTTQRLIHLGRSAVVYALDEILEADVASDQLLLVVGDNRGVAIDVGDPLLLRVEIAAARSAVRAAGRPTPADGATAAVRPISRADVGTGDAKGSQPPPR